MRTLSPLWRQLPALSPVRPRALVSGLTTGGGDRGPLVELRRLLFDTYSCRELLLTDSGTSALRLAIQVTTRSLGVNLVALPSYCCFDVATAAVGANAGVALYDLDPRTLGPDGESLDRCLRAGARCVVVAHLYGVPVDLDRTRALCGDYGAVLIEDAAQGTGGFWSSSPLGSLGDVGVLSFGRGKGRTGGGGGALLVNSAISKRMLDGESLSLEKSGLEVKARVALAAQWLFGRPSFYGIPASLPFLGLGETRFRSPWQPRELAASQAAALLANWTASEEAARRRRELVGALRDSGPTLAGEPCTHPQATPGWLRYPVVRVSTDPLTNGLLRRGVARGYPRPLSELDVIRERSLFGAEYPGAAVLADRLVTLPTHQYVSLEELLRLRACLTKDAAAGAPASEGR